MEVAITEYQALFAHISKLRKQLEKCSGQSLLDNYIEEILESRDLDYRIRLDDVILDASRALIRKCESIMHGSKGGNDTWFTRLARAYIKAHPLEYSEYTRRLVYTWMLFPLYFRFLMEDRNADDVFYGRKYSELCKKVGRFEIDKLIKLFNNVFLLNSAADVELRAGHDQMMALLLEHVEEENCHLWELLLERQELLDYQWFHTYWENEKKNIQGE